MAEIRIEEKKNSWIPWLLGIVGLVLIAWLAVDVFDEDGEPELATADEVNFPDLHINDDRTDIDAINAMKQENTPEGYTYSSSEEDNEYGTYLASIEKFDEGEMHVDHDHSHDAIMALASSLERLATDLNIQNDKMIMEKTQTMRQKANQITKDWKSTKHADQIREAAICAAEVVAEIQNKKFPDMRSEASAVKSAAKGIDPMTLTLDQTNAVKNFFQTTANSIDAMRGEETYTYAN